LVGFRCGTGLSHANTEIQLSLIPLKLTGMTEHLTIFGHVEDSRHVS
jgi:hypothetical protein